MTKQKVSNIARNSWYTFITLTSLVGFRFLITIFIIRALGPVGQGTYYLLITFSALIVQIMSMGIGTANSVFLSKRKYELSEIHTASLILVGFLGLCAAGIYYVLSPLVHATLLKGIDGVYGWFVIAILPLALYGVSWQGIMYGLDKIIQLNKVELGSVILQITLLVAFLNLGYGLAGALVAWSLGLLAVAIAGWWIIAKEGAFTWCFNAKLLRQAAQFGFASQWGEIARLLIVRSDVFLLNLLIGPGVVSYYSVALSLSEKFWLAYTSMYRAAIHKIQSLSTERAAQLLVQVTSGMNFVVSIVAVILGLGSPWIIPILYGPQYIRSVLPFIILLVSLIPYGVWIGVKIYIIGQLSRPNLASAIQWGTSLVSFVIYYQLIRSYGIIGAALGSTISYSILCFTGVYVVYRLTRIQPLDLFFIRKDQLLNYGRFGLKRFNQFISTVYKL